MRSFERRVRLVLLATVRSLRGHDLALTGAGLTFYAGIAIVPSLLFGTWTARLVLGRDRVLRLADSVGAALPDSLGAPSTAHQLVVAGAGLGGLGALVALFPASVYGEGLRRAFLALERDTERMAGWRGRLRVLPVLALTPILVPAVLLVSPWLAQLFDTGRAGPTALGVFVALVVDWLVLALPLTWTYRVVGPSLGSWAAAAWAGFTAASFVSGFLQGFVLFLALPIDLAAPFGGLPVVGAVVALGLWLWVLHLVVLVGYAIALEVDALLRAELHVAPAPQD
ncbi:membrane protein [Motilibacter peucedani]|uniref:Membrane protein n=1 Tax=Motilibacter peucedani TaxID=598650 RepID=A0A420XLV5_9ACTN|nr:membrane protein [Motilibacter peucedani]